MIIIVNLVTAHSCYDNSRKTFQKFSSTSENLIINFNLFHKIEVEKLGTKQKRIKSQIILSDAPSATNSNSGR